MSEIIGPTSGMIPIQCHHPLLPISCNLLTQTHIEGQIKAKLITIKHKDANPEPEPLPPESITARMDKTIALPN